MNVETILASKGREVSTIRPDATVAEALHRMRTEGIGALVVSDDDQSIAGILSDRGIMWALDEQGVDVLGQRVGSVMTREVFTCSPQDSVGTIMATMTRQRFRHIPVVEADGRLCGIISIGDVVKHRLDEIQSEADAMREYITGTL
jgi:CBS domain-containing protein